MSFASRLATGSEVYEDTSLRTRAAFGRSAVEDVEYEVERPPAFAQRDSVQAITNAVLDGIQRMGILSKPSEVDAVTNITVDPPDLQPILDAISRVAVGSKHEEVLEAIRKLDLGSKHSEVLEAVTNIVVDPPDLTPVLKAIDRLEMANRHGEILKAVTNIVVDPPDLTPVIKAIDRLDMANRHGEVLKAVTNIEVDPPDLSPILRAIQNLNMNDKHSEMLKAITKISGEPDLSPITREVKNLHGRHGELLQAITKINVEPDLSSITREVKNLHGRHGELLQAITKINVEPDLSPITRDFKGRHGELLQAISSISVEPPDFSPLHQLVNGMNSSMHDKHREVLQAITSVNVDLSPTEKLLQELRAELRQTREELAGIGQGFDTMRQEIYENRQQACGDADALMAEIKAIPQVLAEMRQAMRKLDQKVDYSEVMQAVRKIKDVDYQAIADIVHGSMPNANNTEVIQHLKRLEPDHHAVAGIIIERLKKVSLNVDHGEVLQAVKKIKVIDCEQVAGAVHERLSRTSLSVNNDELLKELKRHGQRIPDMDQLMRSMEVDLSPVTDAINSINIEVDHSPILSEIRKIKVPNHEEIAGHVHERLKQSHFEILQAIKKMDVQPDLTPVVTAITSAEVDFGPIHEAISSLDLTVDHTPIMEAIRRIKIPDHEEIAATVHERLRRSNLFPDHTEVLKEVRKLRTVDYGPVLEAINSAEIDLGPVHEAIRMIRVPDHGEILQAIRKRQFEMPDHNSIAAAVHDRLTKAPFFAGMHSDVLKEIRKNRGGGDMDTIVEAINKAEVDLSPVIQEIQKVNLNINLDPVLQAISNLRSEIYALYQQPRVVAPAPAPTQYVAAPMTIMEPPRVTLREYIPDPLQRSMPEVIGTSVMRATSTTPITSMTPIATTTVTQPVELIGTTTPGTQSPRFPLSSMSYQVPSVPIAETITSQMGYYGMGSGSVRPPSPQNSDGMWITAEGERSRRESPQPRRAASTPLVDSVVRGPSRRPF